MSLFRRTARRSVLFLLLLTGVCAAQPGTPQFVLPEVEPTGSQVASFLVGNLQEPATLSNDFYYINAPTGSGASSSVLAGELLYQQGFNNLLQNQITFPSVSNVVATLADFNGDGITDYAFALTPTIAGSNNLCLYFGAGLGFGGGAYSGPGGPPAHYPPIGGKSGCMAFPVAGNLPPNFAYIAAPSFRVGLIPQIMVEDSANNILYIFSNSGAPGFGGGLPGISMNATLAIPAADGAGPVSIGDLNNDGFPDLVINGQKGLSASVYLGNGDGTYQPPVRYTFYHNVHSLLLRDMDGDGTLDMVVEGDGGVIEIFHGKGDGTFAATSEGGSTPGLNGLTGNGGHLAAIGGLGKDASPHLFLTTPIGLSVLEQAQPGSLNFALSGIYNIGPGRSSFALQDFNGDGYLDFAVDSPEGVAIALGDALGATGFQTSRAYSALAPALGSVIGKFRNPQNNPKGNLDVVVNTGASQGRLLTGNGDGTFNTFPTPLTPIGLGPPNIWSNILAGDFNGDGNADIAYSLTGLPAPAVISLLVQQGNGDGTFGAVTGVNPMTTGLPNNNSLFGESAVGDFNGDGIADLANIDAAYDDTLLGSSGLAHFSLGLNQPATNTAFNQVAAGFFKANRTAKQDLIFQQGSNLIPYLNSGDGKHFTAMTALAGPAAPYYAGTVLLTDLDNDGKGDVLAVYYNTAANPVGAGPVAPNQLYIWYGNGDGTFGQPKVISLTRNDYLGAVGDMNHDGLPDLVLSDGQIVTTLYNQGARNFGGEQHFLAGQGVNSLSIADVNGDGQQDLIVANGGAAISNPLALGGATAQSISLASNTDVNTGGITVLLNNIITEPVTGTLVATPEPSSVGATFTITATITPSAGVSVPTGFVYFSIDGSPVGAPVQVTAGSATSTASYVVAAGNSYLSGVHTITAMYTGDTHNSSLFLNGTHAIGGATTTTLFLCVGPTAACPSTGVPIAPPPPYPTSLSMYDGQTFNGTAQASANDGTALSPSSSIAFDDAYNGAAPVTLCTLPIAPGSACPPAVGVTIGTGIGTHIFTAVYSGDSSHAGSTSIPVTLTVSPDTVTATIASSLNPAPQGQPVTFTATFTGNYAPPTGTVQFIETFPPTALALLLDTATLAPGSGLSSTATFTTSSLPIGTDPISAGYAGTANFAAASATINQVITPPTPGSFKLSVTPNPSTVGVGYVAGLAVTVTPLNGFTQNVNLACGTLPTEVTCTFLTNAITGGGGTTTLFVGTTAPHTCGTTTPYFQGRNTGPGAFALPALAGLLALFLPGKRRRLRALLVLLVAAIAVHTTGCSTCTDLGTKPATYTIQITATSATTPEVESQTVTLNVTI